MKYVFHASFGEVKRPFSLAFWEFPVASHVPKEELSPWGNLINVVFLSSVLSANFALMTQAVCSSETIIFLYLLQQ
jgi:hypothetical protein